MEIHRCPVLWGSTIKKKQKEITTSVCSFLGHKQVFMSIQKQNLFLNIIPDIHGERTQKQLLDLTKCSFKCINHKSHTLNMLIKRKF